MEKRVCQWSRESRSGCPLRHCSWWCHGAPSRVTKYHSTWWFVGAPSWGCWLYFSSNAKWRHTMTSRMQLFADREQLRLLEGVTVVIQFGSTDQVVRFQWIVHGVGHLAMQLQ